MLNSTRIFDLRGRPSSIGSLFNAQLLNYDMVYFIFRGLAGERISMTRILASIRVLSNFEQYHPIIIWLYLTMQRCYILTLTERWAYYVPVDVKMRSWTLTVSWFGSRWENSRARKILEFQIRSILGGAQVPGKRKYYMFRNRLGKNTFFSIEARDRLRHRREIVWWSEEAYFVVWLTNSIND